MPALPAELTPSSTFTAPVPSTGSLGLTRFAMSRRLLVPVIAAVLATGAAFAQQTPASPETKPSTPPATGDAAKKKPGGAVESRVRSLPSTAPQTSNVRPPSPQNVPVDGAFPAPPAAGAVNVATGRAGEQVDQTPVIRFDPEELDFGELQSGVQQTRTVKVFNISEKPITISRAIPSCGCTTPVWPKDPIAPGASGDMEVTFKPDSRKGVTQKTITLQIDGYAPVRYTLRGHVPEFVKIEPTMLMAPGAPDQPVTDTVTLKSVDGSTFRVTNSIPPMFKGEDLTAAAENAAATHALRIDWEKYAESGRPFRVQVTTDHPREGPLTVQIRRPIERTQTGDQNLTTSTNRTPNRSPAAGTRTLPTSLVYAAQRNDVEEVRRRLEAGDDPDASDPTSLRTALHWAAWNNNVEIIDLLLAKNANLKIVERVGRPALSLAAASGSVAAIERLVAAKADVNARDEHGGSPILWAAGLGSPEAVEALLKAGADPNVQDANGMTPLLWAANVGDSRNVAVLASNPNVQIDVVDKISGENALMRAARNAKVDAVKVLLDRGAKVDARSQHGMTAFLFACETGDVDTIKAILAAKPDVNAKETRRGQNALDLASTRKDPEGPHVVEFLTTELKLQPTGTVATSTGNVAQPAAASKGG